MKAHVLVGFIVLVIVVLILITRQQRERFVVDPVLAQELVMPNIRLSTIQKKQEKLQDAINAGAGKAAMNGIM
jgi:type 1 glutamine amidotransferase